MKLSLLLSLGLLAACGQRPAPLAIASATPTPSTEQQDFSGATTTTEKLNDAYVATVPTPTPEPSVGAPTPQFKSAGAQAAFETYLENYRQMMMPPPISRTEVIDASQIQASLEAISHAVQSVRQSEQNLKGILSPNELRQFKAYQQALSNPPSD